LHISTANQYASTLGPVLWLLVWCHRFHSTFDCLHKVSIDNDVFCGLRTLGSYSTSGSLKFEVIQASSPARLLPREAPKLRVQSYKRTTHIHDTNHNLSPSLAPSKERALRSAALNSHLSHHILYNTAKMSGTSSRPPSDTSSS
jgi:hypothetical protein